MTAKSPTSRLAKRAAKARALREARRKRREDIMEDVVDGADRMVIAKKYGVSLKTVYRDLNRALDERPRDAPERYRRIQIERLNRALHTIDKAILEGEIEVVPHLIKVMDKLDRYHGTCEPPPEPPRLLALTHERTEMTGQVVEIKEGGTVP